MNDENIERISMGCRPKILFLGVVKIIMIMMVILMFLGLGRSTSFSASREKIMFEAFGSTFTLSYAGDHFYI